MFERKNVLTGKDQQTDHFRPKGKKKKKKKEMDMSNQISKDGRGMSQTLGNPYPFFFWDPITVQ